MILLSAPVAQCATHESSARGIPSSHLEPPHKVAHRFSLYSITMAPLSATDIATLCLHNEKYLYGQVHQTEHRIALWSKWNVDWDGAKVLEIGCGQGDFTAVLAEAVGPDGHVTAVDPGPLTYGG